MKTITWNYFVGKLTLGFLLIGCISAFSQTVIHTATFETGNDGWSLSGASRINDASFAAENDYSIRINSNTATMTSPGLLLGLYDKVDFSFKFTNNGYDNGEDFYIEYRPSSLSSWQTVATYVGDNIFSKIADFHAGQTGVDHMKTFTMFATDYTFPILPTGQFRIVSNASSSGDQIYIDDIVITGTIYNTITEGPGGVSSNLSLWLRADKADGSGVLANNSGLTYWEDLGRGNDAKTNLANQAPTYKHNTADNINFNPVIDFNNSSATSTADMTYLSDRDEILGTAGFYSHDIFLVTIPDQPISTSLIPLDTFTSKDPTGETYAEDVTGFGYGSYTNRFTDEYFAYCIGTTNGPGNGYGKGDLTNSVELNQISIINARHNSVGSPTGQNVYLNNIEIGDTESDPGDFAAIEDQRFFLGRSQYWNGSFGGRIAEVITYSATNTDASPTDLRNRIQSYLAIKYGITLGVNGTSQDYVDSSGNVIWDQSAAAGFNHDIAGIGRSDDADLMQRQSKSVNPDTDITMGLTDITTTNANNPNDFSNDESYVVWGNDDGSLAAATPILVDMSDGISGLSTPVDFTSISRTWRVQETGNVGNVKVSIPESTLTATITPPGNFLMFISNTPTFNPTSEYRIMTVNGANLEATYNFPANAVRYITFGYAPEYSYVRSIEFDGVQDYMDADDNVDLTGAFTISAWIKSDSGNTDAEIVSKRNAGPYTAGYGLLLNGSSRVQGVWKNNLGITQSITGNTTIPADEWHYISLVYNGSQARIYIDGVQDGPAVTLGAPVDSDEHLLIAAANYNSPTRFFEGNIDEVRIFDVALTQDQIRYIMNQELVEHTDNTVNGTIVPQSITKNDISTVPWSNLEAYYPMTTYTFTNVNDASGNNNWAAIKNLNTVDFQTAPLPYVTQSDGDWYTTSNWLNGGTQQLPQETSIVDGTTLIEWNIVDIDHNLTSSLNTTVLAADVAGSVDLIMDNDNKFEVSHYLKLDGFLDLQGESQLVQTEGSIYDVTSTGYLERDQAGTADNYTYNYWGSPVGRLYGTTINRPFKLNYHFKDGTNPSSPLDINWTWGFDGAPGTPITLSAYWIFTFENGPIGSYDDWTYLGPFTFLEAGQGFTLKGSGTGGVTDNQNYTFTGKPNNDQVGHEIQLTINAGHNYLVGNPFASALDADDFIADNPHLDGTLYFWDHFGGGSHTLAEYQGGYAMYNLSGGTPALSHPLVSQTGTGSTTPGRYVPVGQGFFVAADSDGTIEFNNGQRNFVKPGATSVFTFAEGGTNKTAPIGAGIASFAQADDRQFDNPDNRMKLRIGFDSSEGFHRQLLLTFDDNATLDYDRAYDGQVFEDQVNDMNWLIDDNKYAIQAIPNLVSDTKVVLPLWVKVAETGTIKIGLDDALNLSEKLFFYLHDKYTNTYTKLRNNAYKVSLNSGVYDDRFEIVLRTSPIENSNTKSIAKTTDYIGASHQKTSQLISVYSKDNKEQIAHITVYNTIGQLVGEYSFSGTNPQEVLSSSTMASGTYILQTTTNKGVHTTKILIEK